MKFLLLVVALTIELLGGTFRVATYNVELYVDRPFSNVQPKTDLAKKHVREAIRVLNADILALQEMGGTNALLELRASLQKEGLHYPHWSHVQSQDQSLHLAFLSKFPITAQRHHRKESYLFQGRRHYVQRGFGEVDVQVSKNMEITLITAHLKSKRVVVEGDQQGMREEEAVLLREKVDQFYRQHPRGNLIVLGDFNDSIDSRTLRTILGRGKAALFDVRPAERNGDTLPNPNPQYKPRHVVWTHYYGKEEIFGRIDYLMVSPSLRARLVPSESYVLALANWGTASDHRPVTALFQFD